MAKKRLSAHDRYIRSMFTHPEVVREFFDRHIPEPLKACMDLSSIHIQKDSFVTDQLRLQIADLLFSVTINNKPGYVYCLLEHASTPDKMLPYRMLKYMTAIMDQHMKKHKTQVLPFIYPLILYTGNKPYRYSTDLFTLFDENEELARQTFNAPYALVDLTQVSDEALRQYQWFGTAALIAKHIHDADILPVLKDLMEILKVLEKQGAQGYIYTVISYIVEAGDVSDQEAFINTLAQGLTSVSEEKLMTLAEKFRQEGVQQGIQQGMQQGIQQGMQQGIQQGMQQGIQQGMQQGKQAEKQEIVRQMLLKGLPVEMITEITGVSAEELQKLHH